VTGCIKDQIDGTCIQACEKSSAITNLKEETFLINKSKGNYHCIYNETNFLNTAIITDVQHLFTGFFIDLRDIKTGTNIEQDKSSVISLFENLLNGNPGSEQEIKQTIHPTTFTQYSKGI
jgi:putative protease